MPIKYANKQNNAKRITIAITMVKMDGHMSICRIVKEHSSNIHRFKVIWDLPGQILFIIFPSLAFPPTPTVYFISPSRRESFWRQFPIFCLNSRNQYCVKHLVPPVGVRPTGIRDGCNILMVVRTGNLFGYLAEECIFTVPRPWWHYGTALSHLASPTSDREKLRPVLAFLDATGHNLQ